MPMSDDPKFLQMYLMGSCEERVTTRCLCMFHRKAEERAILEMLEIFFWKFG